MNKNVVKGLIFIIIIACIIVIIAFCNSKPTTSPTPKPSQNITSTPNQQQTPSASPDGTDATPTETAKPTPTPNPEDQIPTVESTQITKNDIDGLSDKNIIVNLNYPKIVFNKKPEVANKINAYIDDTKSTDIQMAGFYAELSSDSPAEISKNYSVKLLNNKYLSLLIQSQYKQGATETEYLDYAYTFDLTTGNVVTDKQLVIDETTFRGKVAAQILTQIYDSDYIDSLCQDFDNVIANNINNYWDDTMWYFTETAFVVFFNPNTIGTPELGILTYEIPMTELEDCFK